MSDLVSVLALPAVWNAQEPRQIVTTFDDALMAALNLDFLYTRAKIGADGEPIEILRTPPHYATAQNAERFRHVLNKRFGDDPRKWPAEVRGHFGGQETSLLSMRLGVEGEIGIVVAGSERADFPTQSERLLLGVAANQVTVGLQQARLLSEQKRIASELDRRVAERTKELAESNDALQASERNLSLIVSAMPVLAWSARADGSAEFLNQRWLEYSGLSAEQAKDWGWTAVIHPDDLDRLSNYWKSAISTGKPVEIEARMRQLDGTYRWFLFRANPFRDASGTIVKWYGTNVDIDDRKRAEEALRESEQRFRLIVDGIAGLVAIMSPTGELEVVNHRVLTYFGKTVEQLKGWSTSNAVHADDRPAVISAWTHSIETASVYDIDHRLLGVDGEYRWFHARGLPLCDAEGRALRWYVLLTDIHDRKQAEEALSRARVELAHVTRATSLGVLTASIAHEVNQPLSGIITNANTCLRMLSGNPPNIDGARETARRTIRDGNRASEVVMRLRALFRKKDAIAEPVDLNDAAREVIALSLSELQSNRIMVRHEFAENLPAVKGDRVQLQQVILNLLRNALDAMRDVEDWPRELLIKTEVDDSNNVRLTVQDTGIGFAPDAAERLFESFYTTKDDGMGIGLSVSRSIIEAHRGRLWASANDGPGSSFAFSIPHDCSTEPT